MHEWQDSYVHYDRGYRWWLGGHIWDPSVDDPQDPVNIQNRAYERCDYTTRELEKIWFKYDIELWMEIPTAELPTENPWYSIYVGMPAPDWLVNYWPDD